MPIERQFEINENKNEKSGENHLREKSPDFCFYLRQSIGYG